MKVENEEEFWEMLSFEHDVVDTLMKSTVAVVTHTRPSHDQSSHNFSVEKGQAPKAPLLLRSYDI